MIPEEEIEVEKIVRRVVPQMFQEEHKSMMDSRTFWQTDIGVVLVAIGGGILIVSIALLGQWAFPWI